MGEAWRDPPCRLEGYDYIADRQHHVPWALREQRRYLIVMGLTEEAADRFLMDVLNIVACELIEPKQ